MVGISSKLWACDELGPELLTVKLEKNHGEAWHSSHSLHTFSNFLLVPQNSLHLPSRLICEYNSTQTLASFQIFQICVSLGHVLYFQSQGYTHQNQIHYKLWVALNLMLSTNDVVFKQEAENGPKSVTQIPLFLSHVWHLSYSPKPPVPFVPMGHPLDSLSTELEASHSDHQNCKAPCGLP